MGAIRAFESEKLVMGVLSVLPAERGRLKERLESLWGGIDYESETLPFDMSPYYEPEMGRGILRSFLSFERLVDPSELATIKIKSNSIEEEFAQGGKRRVNLDPGLLSLGRFVLATTKNRCQRIPLRDGIYAEVTLVYEKCAFRPLPWTYPDYRSEAYGKILNDIRGLLKARIDRERGRQESH
jgi:hypothetical protein